MSNVWTAFGLTLFAGMGTAVGSGMAFAVKKKNFRLLSIITGFSAGAMLYISFVEIFSKAVGSLVPRFGEIWAHWVNVCSFFCGMLLIGLIDNLTPASKNPHEIRAEAETLPLHNPSVPAILVKAPRKEGIFPPREEDLLPPPPLLRMGMVTALAIGIHNFPEGLATFLASLQDPDLGVTIAIAVALHNIPEGISVAVPIFYATGSRKKAFLWSSLSGLAEPVGAVAAYVAMRFSLGGNTVGIPDEIMGILFGAVAGIMVYISLDELLPTSKAYGKGHDSLLGLVAGILVMALSLLLMK